MKNKVSWIPVCLVPIFVTVALMMPALVLNAGAASPFIIDSWLEEPNLSVSYIWNLYERRDSNYLENWSEEELAAVDTFEFGMREALKVLGVSAKIEQHHSGDAWIKLYNVATNLPGGSDYPPHINVMSMWGEAGKDYEGGINGHYYATASGALNAEKTWYAWHTTPTCPRGERKPGVGVWVAHVDQQCRTIYEERVTAEGTIEIRIGPGDPVYTLLNKAPSDLDILRDGEPVRNVRRVFHNAWINYPEPYPEGTAKVVWEIRDYSLQRLTTETIIANPETGKITTHEREESPLAEELPTSVPDQLSLYLPSLQR